MIQTIRQALHLLSIRLSNIISRGVLKKITSSTNGNPIIQKAQVTLLKGEVIDGMEFPQTYGFISMPTDGASVIAFFFGGNRDHGTVGTIFDKRYVPDDLEEGESCIYNTVAGTRIYLRKNGDVEIKSGTKIKMDTPLVQLTGRLEADGDIRDNVPTNNHTVKDMRDIFNDHVHPGVFPGAADTQKTTTSQ